MKHTKSKKIERLRQYDRLMLRSAFVSMFWGAISERRKIGKFTLQSIAKRLGTNKSAVSRWFSGDHPNWTVDKIADIADVLNLDLHIEAIDRTTGMVFTAMGTRPLPTNQPSLVNLTEQTAFIVTDRPRKPIVHSPFQPPPKISGCAPLSP